MNHPLHHPHPAAKPTRAPAPRVSRAFTFLEMMLALTVITLIGTAICALIVGSMNTDRFLRYTNAAQSEIELAVDRLSNNIRTAQSGSIVTGTSTLTTITQPDTANGYPLGATVSYSLAPDPNNAAKNVLIENDQRFGSNILLHNVATFTIAPVASYPNLYQIDLVTSTRTPEERHFKVLARN